MGDLLDATGAARARYRRGLLGAVLLGLAFWFLAGAGVAHASRFGPPWQGQVAVDRTVVYTQPDLGSPPVGPLWRGAIVVVLNEQRGADGSEWLQIPDGYIPSEEVNEMVTPWTAEVTVASASVYAYPFVASGARRTVRQGDLLRVTGVAAGLEGDTGIWWATTEGYLRLGTLRWATEDWAGWWQLPDASEAPRGWWGVIGERARVRTAPSTDAPVVGFFAGGERVKVLAEEQGAPIDGDSRWYRIDGGRFAGGRIHASVVRRLPDPKPNTAPPPPDAASGPWIVVDRKTSTLTFVRDGQAQFTTYVSIGKAGVVTPTGLYATFGKYRGDRMSSRFNANPTHVYDLPNVPFTQYYKEGGYAVHGTYWHDGFGLPESQGCINLTWTDSAYLFGLTRPTVYEDEIARWGEIAASTPVVILN